MEKWLVIGTDERLRTLAKKMTSPSRTVFYRGSDVWDATLNATVLDFFPDYIVLPIQPMKIEVPLLLGIKHAQFFVGRLNEHWEALLKDQNVARYLEDESFIWKNAALTAEGLLAYFYERQITISGKSFIVTGIGRVAKMVAMKLQSLHAKVTIAVRSPVQKSEAKVYGFEVIDLKPEAMIEANALINTVPAQWLTQPFNERITMPIFDVASSPGCLYYVIRPDYVMLSSLPGKYFADDAAQILYESIVEEE